MILLAMYGRARSGKDTAADYLAQQLGLYKYAFAEPLKTMLKSVFGDHFHEGDRSGICHETGKSYREMMQTLGTDLGRNLWNEDVWINLVQKKWDWVKDGCPHETHLGRISNLHLGKEQVTQGMILSDLRFDSEAEWVRSQGGYVIEIKRDERPKSLFEKILSVSGVEVGIPGHQSEAGISHSLVDMLCCNHSSLEDLHQLLDALVEAIKKPEFEARVRQAKEPD